MSIDSDIFAALQASAGLTALIGTGTDCRAYPDEAPQDCAYPLVTFFRIAGVEEFHLGGSTNLLNARYQFSCWGQTFDSADATAQAVRTALLAATAFKVAAINTYAGPVEPELKLFHRIVDVSTWSEL